MGHTETKNDRAALWRELSEFLVELSIALHKHSMYPSGHPSIEPAVRSVARRAEALLAERPVIAFGVARRQLIIEGYTTDPNQPLLRRLAESLHRHHLGAVSVARGIALNELAEGLRLLSTDADRDGPIGLRQTPSEWPHLRLHPLTFDRLSLAGETPTARRTGEPGGSGGPRGAELWVGLARAAIVSRETADSTPVPTDPSSVAHAIDEKDRPAAYDQVIVGHLLQIAGELKSAPNDEVEALRKRTSALIGALRPETLRRLVEMGGNIAQRGEFVLDATHGMDVEAVLRIVHATADANGQLISNGLVRLMSKLAFQASGGREGARPVADQALRDQVIQLLAGWELADPNPEHYSRVLQHLAAQAVDASSDTLKDGDKDEVGHAIRIVQIAIEIGTTGHTVERAIDRLTADGHAAAIVDLLKARPPGSDQVADAIIAQLVRPSSLSTLVNREPLDEASLDALLPFLSEEGFQTLLDALASSENRATRRKLIDRLARAALDTGPYIAARLEDERWYVLRNMLLLMERSGHVPEGFSATRWTTHQDARVRYEALRLQLTIARERDRAIRTAIDDEDPRIVRLGLATLQQECSPAYAARLAAIAVDPKTDAELRLLAVNALGRMREPGALEVLLAVVDGGRTFFGRPRLAAKTPVMLAALRGLAHTWADHPRATAVLARAVQSPDADVRQASQAQSS